MGFPWTIDSIPELLPFDPVERRRIWREQSLRNLKDPWYYLVAILGGCCGLAGYRIACSVGDGRWVGLLGLAIGGGIGGWLVGLFGVHRTRRRIAADNAQ